MSCPAARLAPASRRRPRTAGPIVSTVLVPLLVVALATVTGCGVLGDGGAEAGETAAAESGPALPAGPTGTEAFERTSVAEVRAALDGDAPVRAADRGSWRALALVTRRVRADEAACGPERCAVTLLDERDRTLAVAEALWVDGAVADVAVDSRYSPADDDHGLGAAACSPGAELIFGGVTERGLSVIICAAADDGAAPALEYVAADATTLVVFRLAACVTGDGTWHASRSGTNYYVRPEAVTVESTIGVVPVEDRFDLTWTPASRPGPAC